MLKKRIENQKVLFYLCLFFLSLIFYACSSVKISYNWADYILYRQIDSYFDLAALQESIIDHKLDKFHIWHRKKELPKYINFLERLKLKVKDGVIDKDDLIWFYNSLKVLNFNLLRYIADDSIIFLASLSSDQINYFKETLVEKNQERLEEIKKTEEERREEFYDRAVDSAEMWLGDLSDIQKKTISKMLVVSREEQMVHYNYRIKAQQSFIKTLEQKQSTPEFRQLIEERFFNYQKFYTREYSELVKKRRNRGQKIIMKIYSQSTKEQRTYLINQIDYYIEQLKDLHNQN